MQTPRFPHDEASRLHALNALELLDTPAEARFDRITRIAQRHFHVPIALVSLVDAQRQWFKSRQGLEACETPRDLSFCGHAVLGDGTLVVPNALEDARFHDNPLVTSAPHIRFYAGAVVHAPDGARIGTLCIIDTVPRSFDTHDLQQLRDLADCVEAELARTQLLENQHALESSSLRWELAVASANFGVWEWDTVHNVLTWDARMFEIYGVQPSAFLGAYEAWSNGLHPDDNAASQDAINKALRGEAAFDTEFRVVHPGGEIRFVKAWGVVIRDDAGQPLRMIGINQDITRSKQIQQQLVHSEARIRAIVDTVVDGIISIDMLGSIQTVNPAAERIFGYPREEMLGRNINMLMPEPFHSAHDGYLANYAKTGQARIIGTGREVAGQRKDGSVFPMELAVSEMATAQERLFTGVVRDISERKKLERIKSEFVSTVSHELRTPLTSIRGALGLVLGKVGASLPDKARSMLEMAERNSERLTVLINDLLDLEKIESGRLAFEFHNADLLALARRAVEENAGYAVRHNVRLALHSPLERAMVLGDEHRLLQVFANLISNAVKYSPKDGVVEVTLDATDAGFRVGVRDHGAGIAPEFRGHIFGRFAQADSSDTREKGGTGLGLSITKAIVERHEGKIDYASERGAGTLFYFDIPGVIAAHAADPDRLGEPLVLICEDNPDVASILAAMLEPVGIRSDIATTAQAARELLARTPYRLLLLDLTLPDADGLQFLQELRIQPATASLPVIVVSGRAHEGRASFAGDGLAVVDWLQKPVEQHRLERALHEALRRAGRPKVLHVEDDLDIGQVVQSLLEDTADLYHVGSLRDARTRLACEPFDLVILDLGLPDGNGIDLIDELKGRCPVVIFSAQTLGRDVTQQVTAALTKSTTSNSQLLETIVNLLNQKGLNRV